MLTAYPYLFSNTRTECLDKEIKSFPLSDTSIIKKNITFYTKSNYKKMKSLLYLITIVGAFSAFSPTAELKIEQPQKKLL